MPEDTMVAEKHAQEIAGVSVDKSGELGSEYGQAVKRIGELPTGDGTLGELQKSWDLKTNRDYRGAIATLKNLKDQLMSASTKSAEVYQGAADSINPIIEAIEAEAAGDGQAGTDAENPEATEDEVPPELLAFGAKLNPTSSPTNGTGTENGSAMGAGSDETQVTPPKTAEAPAEDDESEEDASELVVGDEEAPSEDDPKIGAEIAAADDGSVVEDEAANTFNRMNREEIIAALENLPRVGKFATLVAEQIVELRESGIEIHNTAELYQHVQVKGIGPKGTNVIAEALGFVPIADLKPKYRRKDKKADDAILARETTSADPTSDSIADFRAGVAAERSGSMMRAVSATMTKFFNWIGGKFSFKGLSMVEDYSRANGSAQEQTTAQQPAATPETLQEAPPADETAKKPEDMTADELRAKIAELTKLIDDERNASNELVLQRAEHERNKLKKELEKKAPKVAQEQPPTNQVDVANFDLEQLPPGQRQAAMEIVNNPKLSEKRKQFLIGLLLIAAGAATSASLRALEATNGPINAGIALVLRVALTDAVTITLDMNAARLAGSNIPGKDFMANALKGIARGIRGSRERIIKFLIGFGGDAILATAGLDVNEVVDKAVDNINSLDQSTTQAVNQGANTNAQQSQPFWSRLTSWWGQGGQQGASAPQAAGNALSNNPPPLDIPAPSANPDIPAAANSPLQSSVDVSDMPTPTPDQGLGFTGTEPAEVPAPEVRSTQPLSTEEINPNVRDWMVRSNWPEENPFNPDNSNIIQTDIVKINDGIVWNALESYFSDNLPAEYVMRATDVVKDVVVAINPDVDFTRLPSENFTVLQSPADLGSEHQYPWMLPDYAIEKLADTAKSIKPENIQPGTVQEILWSLFAGFPAEQLTAEQREQVLNFAYTR